jgi:Ca-activated chloride channel family protein
VARLLHLLLVLAIVGSGAVRAQDEGDEVRLDTDLVTIDLVVTNAQGEYVTDLKQTDVRIFEDGQPRGIDFFSPASQLDSNRPLACVIALDISGSITKEEIQLQRQAAQRFTGLVRPESLFGVIGFNHDVKILQKLTNDPKSVGKGFDKLGPAGGATRIFDALDQAVNLLSKAPATRNGRRLRRVVVVVTDGYDNASTIAPIELIRRATAAGVTIYSITLPSYMTTLQGTRERVLTILEAHGVVAATGGKDYSADRGQYEPIFRAIAEEVASGYQLAIYPPDAKRRDGKFHPLRVEVTRPGLTLRASRNGYESPAK